MTEDEARVAVIAEAETWIGTPFHDCAAVKGAGVDCIHFGYAVYRAVGLVPEVLIPKYSPQWAMHRDAEMLLMAVEGYAHEVSVPRSGDIVLVKYGRAFSHLGLVTLYPRIIHAFKESGFVLAGDLTQGTLAHYNDGRPREQRFFSVWGHP